MSEKVNVFLPKNFIHGSATLIHPFFYSFTKHVLNICMLCTVLTWSLLARVLTVKIILEFLTMVTKKIQFKETLVIGISVFMVCL